MNYNKAIIAKLKNLQSKQILLYIFLLDLQYRNKATGVSLTNREISNEVGIHYNTTVRALRVLKQKQLIEVSYTLPYYHGRIIKVNNILARNYG